MDRYTSSPCLFLSHLQLQLSDNVSLLQSSTYYQSIPDRLLGKHTRPHQHLVYFQILLSEVRISLLGVWKFRAGSSVGLGRLDLLLLFLLSSLVWSFLMNRWTIDDAINRLIDSLESEMTEHLSR